MGRTRFVLVFLVLASIALPATASIGKRTTPGSFVTRCVSSVDDLCTLVKRDPVVAKRFAKHFGVPTDRIVQYFRENLRVVSLRRGGKYKTFFVDKRGRIVPHSTYLLTGERVFVTRDGKPVLIAKCGNPVSKVLPSVQENRAVAPIAQPELISPIAEAGPAMGETVAMQPPTWEVAAMPIAELPLMPAITPVLTKASSSALIPLLLGAGALIPSDHHHPVVPEPSSLLVLLVGLPALAGFARFRPHK
jgi:hypothetical protein